jgi:acylphosphatase
MAKHLHITGLVQGVGYRASFAALADALQLSGWVRNRRDGAVEASIAGQPEAIRQLIDWAKRGPAGAQVREVAVTEIDDALITENRFQIRPTV